jgi:hypothetical protein
LNEKQSRNRGGLSLGDNGRRIFGRSKNRAVAQLNLAFFSPGTGGQQNQQAGKALAGETGQGTMIHA